MNSLSRVARALVLLWGSAALAWNYEYGWYDPAAPTTPAKPGGGGVFGTGSKYEGTISCSDCHLPHQHPGDQLVASVDFVPSLDAGTFLQYQPGVKYTVTVTMLNEHHVKPDGGPETNNFAGVFEDNNGALVGDLETDTGIDAGICPVTTAQGTSAPQRGTTYMYRKSASSLGCDVIFSRYVKAPTANALTQWTFKWRAPPSSTGPVHFAFGVVDGNGNDRNRATDGGAEDDVYMGKLVLMP